jgi:hypothetical protein
MAERDRLVAEGQDTKNATRELLLDAFRALRKQGFIARADFLCCSSCASAALSAQAAQRVDSNKARPKPFKGIAYWHKQADDAWWDCGELTIGFSGYEAEGVTWGLPIEQVGQAVVMELVKRGVRTEWDGTAGRKIAVFAK